MSGVRMLQASVYLAALSLAATGLIALNARANADIGGQECLLLLLLETAALGAAAPRWAWLTGGVIGAALGISGLATVEAGGRLPANMHPAGLAGAASLLVLVVPALAVAQLAAALRRQS